MKTVIFVWTQEVCNLISNDKDNFWGIGDILRGIIHTYQLCKQLNYEFIVDIQLHPISQFLINTPHKYSDLILSKKDNIHFISNTKDFILSNPSDVIYFETNNHFHEPLTLDCKDYIKTLLTPTPEFAVCLRDARDKIPWPIYSILHYRLGDPCMITHATVNFDTLLLHIKKNMTGSAVLLSDSQKFKEYIKKEVSPSPFMFDTLVGHVGFSKHKHNLRGTLIEFFICQSAQNIRTYSVYQWLSGFVKCIHDIYDIPIIQI